MAAKNELNTEPADRVLVIKRTFDAPLPVVWKAWAEPQQALRWWGPRGFTVPFHKLDMRVGGSYRCCLRSPEGVDHWQRGVYREIVEQQRIVFTFAWEDEQGKPGHETLVTITFAEDKGKTVITLHQATFKSKESRDGHKGGWSESFDRLGEVIQEMTAHNF